MVFCRVGRASEPHHSFRANSLGGARYARPTLPSSRARRINSAAPWASNSPATRRPRSAAWAGSPVKLASSFRRPSRESTRPVSTNDGPSRRPQAATGARQPPRNSANIARSARTAAWVAGSSSGRSSSRAAWSSLRVSNPRAPARRRAGRRPAATPGKSVPPVPAGGVRPRPGPGRRNSPSSSFRNRVSTLPRISFIARSGRTWSNCDRRRRLPVPTRDPRGNSSSEVYRRQTRTSLSGARGGTAASSSPGTIRWGGP